MSIPERLSTSSILFLILVLAFSAAVSSTSLAETPRFARPLVLRYDGTQITLSTEFVALLLNRKSIRKQIGEQVKVITLVAEDGVQQPKGVMTAILSIYVKDEVEDEDALFKSARKVVAKELNQRLSEPSIRRLDEKLKIAEHRLSRLTQQLELEREQFAKTVLRGSPEVLQGQLDELQHGGFEMRVDQQVDSLRQRMLQESLSDFREKQLLLDKKKSELAQAIRKANVDQEKSGKLIRQLQDLLMTRETHKARYGPGHPHIQKVTSQIDAIGKELGTTNFDEATAQLNESMEERKRLEATSFELSSQQEAIRKRSEQLAAEVESASMEARLAEFREKVLVEERASLRDQLKDALKEAPAAQSRIQEIERQMRSTKLELERNETALRAQREVVVEIW